MSESVSSAFRASHTPTMSIVSVNWTDPVRGGGRTSRGAQELTTLNGYLSIEATYWGHLLNLRLDNQTRSTCEKSQDLRLEK